MHTNAVIDCLVRRAKPVPVRAVERRIGAQAAVGGIISLVFLAIALGVRSDLGDAVKTFAFWMKAGYVGAILLLSLTLLPEFARPELNPTRKLILLAAPVLALTAAAAVEFAATPSVVWRDLIMGMSAGKCSVRIAIFAVPGFIALITAFRRFAPTFLVHTGATIGIAAGAIGSIAYMFYCREVAASFVLVWYTLGILLMGTIGGVIGPVVLKWK